MDNAASQKQVKAKGKYEDRLMLRDKADLQKLCGMPEFRRFVRRLKDFSGLDKTMHDPSGSNVYYKTGKRDVMLLVQTEIKEIDIKLWHQIEIEEKDDLNV